ncbi:helix-turn-helix domain-containing protein [Providencia rettgeri]|uniref:helix-turn-helix domain-containing protein n=1 Tax=Morganella morganii TaxID=582 RepID=UPI0034E66DC8
MSIIKKLRQLSGLTKHDVSTVCGLSISDITLIENDITPPPQKMLDLYSEKSEINSRLLYSILSNSTKKNKLSIYFRSILLRYINFTIHHRKYKNEK